MTTNAPFPTQQPSAAVDALRTALWAVLNSEHVTTEQTVCAGLAFETLNDVTPAYPPVHAGPTDDRPDVWTVAVRAARDAADAATDPDDAARIAAAADLLAGPDVP